MPPHPLRATGTAPPRAVRSRPPGSRDLQLDAVDRRALRVLEVRAPVRAQLPPLPPVPRRLGEALEPHVGALGVVAIRELPVGIVIGDADEVLAARAHVSAGAHAVTARLEAPAGEVELARVG